MQVTLQSIITHSQRLRAPGDTLHQLPHDAHWHFTVVTRTHLWVHVFPGNTVMNHLVCLDGEVEKRLEGITLCD